MTRTLCIIVAFVVAAFTIGGILVGIFEAVSETGPGCPAPVPADWLGYCDDFILR